MLIIIVTDYKAVLTSAFNFMAVDLPGNILFYCAQQLKQRQCDTSRPGTVTKESTVAEVPSHLEPVCEDGGRSHEVCTEPVTVEVPGGSLHTHSEPAWEDDGRCDEAVTEPAMAKVRRTSVRSHSARHSTSTSALLTKSCCKAIIFLAGMLSLSEAVSQNSVTVCGSFFD